MIELILVKIFREAKLHAKFQLNNFVCVSNNKRKKTKKKEEDEEGEEKERVIDDI